MFCFCCATPDEMPSADAIESPPETTKQSYHLSAASSKWTATAHSTTHLYQSSKSYKDDDTSSQSTGFTIENRFEVLQAIGQGSFGTVYHGNDLEKNTPVAVKILKHTGHQSYYRETKVLERLENIDGIPQMFWKGRIRNKDILIITRLGRDVSMLFALCKHKFSVGTTLKLGLEMTKLLQKVHSHGIIHRDIKPHNFLFGYPESHKMFIVDFGLAKTYLSSNQIHKTQQSGLRPIGTARYASRWTHLGFSQSRRDDLESVGFVLVYFLIGKLPWQGLKISSKHQKWSKIGDVKINTPLDDLCDGLPSAFQEYLKYIRQLKFQQQPNYKYLINLFVQSAQDNDIDLENVVWDWENIQSSVD